MPTLYLIDGYAQFFRAYHAIRTPMTSPVTKEPTNMTFGFIGMMLKLLRGEGKVGAGPGGGGGGKPDYIAVTLDVSGDRGTFRSELYEEYKANRPPPPEDLGPQVDRCLALLKEVGVPIVGAEGFEADDCIATLVTRLGREHPDLNIRIISKDKDLKQLLKDGEGAVELYDIHTDLLITEQSLKEETGLTPPQVIDMLALMGDTVDNVPGVEGVGPKTAAKLVAEHGNVAGVLAAAVKGQIKGKIGERLQAMPREDLELSRRLVTLRHDAPAELDLASAAPGKFNLAALIPILKELGFNRYQDEVRALMGGGGGGGGGAAAGGDGAKAGVAAGATERSAGGAPSLFAPASSSASAKASPGAEAAGQPSAAKGKGARGGPAFTGGLFDAPAGGAGGEGGAAQRAFIAPQSGEYRAITTRAQLKELVEELRAAEVISIDTETTGLSPLRCKLCGISLSTRIGTGVYVPVRSPDAASHLDEQTVLEALRPVLEDPAKAKCGHNLKYDVLVLRNAGVRVAGFFGAVGEAKKKDPSLTLRTRKEGAEGDPSLTLRTLKEDGGDGWIGRESGGVGAVHSVVFDSMVASYLIDASRSSHGLDSLSLALLNRTNISITDLIGPRVAQGGEGQRTFDMVPLDQATQYAAEDADVALQLRAVMLPQLKAMGLMPLFEQVEMPLVEVLAELEWNGIRVDRAELDRQRARLQKRIDELKKQITAASMESIGRTFNPDSPKQLAAALFNKADDEDEPGLGLRPVKRIKTGYSTDAEVLEKLAQDPEVQTPIPGLIVEHRELTKLVNTYLVALVEEINPQTGRIHSSFNQTVAATGRLASSDPNLQNIPIRTDIGREIRRAFVADEGPPRKVLLSADYSQIELRLLAHLSKDPALIAAFHEGQDIHTAVAAQINQVPLEKVTKQQRNGAKMVNFGIVYGITSFGLARRLGVSNTAAAEIIDGYKRRFSGITTFLQECIEQAGRLGYVETMLKRRRPIMEIFSTNPSRRALGERTAINSVVQGSAADLIKLAMVDIEVALEAGREERGDGGGASTARGAKGKGDAGGARQNPADDVPRSCRMLLQIHDELVFEVDEDEAERARAFVIYRMENAMQVSVPLKVDASVARNWFEGK